MTALGADQTVDRAPPAMVVSMDSMTSSVVMPRPASVVSDR